MKINSQGYENMSDNEIQNQPKARPSMTVLKATSATLDLNNHCLALLETDPNNSKAQKMLSQIVDTIDDDINDEDRYQMYQATRLKAKVYNMADHMQQRVSKESMTPNEQNYHAQILSLAQGDVLNLKNGSKNLDKYNRRAKAVSKEDRANGVKPVQRNHDDASLTALFVSMREDASPYNQKKTYQAPTEGEQ